MPLSIVRGDISEIKADALVNTVSEYPSVGAGTDSGIHKKAGAGLFRARQSIGRIPVGQAAVTRAFGLRARYVIHTSGPVWRGGSDGEEQMLRSCYRSCLELASENDCRSIAFPLLCAGHNGFPNELALRIATEELSRFLLTNDMNITLAVFDRRSFVLSEKLTGAVEQYIDERYVREKTAEEHSGYYSADDAEERPGAGRGFVQLSQSFSMRKDSDAPGHGHAKGRKRADIFHSVSDNMPEHSGNASAVSAGGEAYNEEYYEAFEAYKEESDEAHEEEHDVYDTEPSFGGSARRECGKQEYSAPMADSAFCPPDWDDVLSRADAGFSETLLRLIDRTGRKDSEIYKRANVDRKLFSKIRTNADYRPSKSTALAFAIALELDLDETMDLISRAGYTLSHSSKSDIIVEYFIESRNYNVFELNEVLFAYHQPLIGV